jgi:predicted acylesterase/phospholipase RssA
MKRVMTRLSRRLVLLGIVCTLGTAPGCSALLGSIRLRNPVPEALANAASVPGLPHVRTWGDGVSENYRLSLVESARQEKAYYEAHPNEKMPETVDILCISGGGQSGAHSAGLLCGWTASGTRPQFRLVTGVSTGGLIAPLAFLGPKYDAMLKEGYTTTTTKSIMDPRGLLRLLRADSVANTEPLAKLIAKWITPETLKEIAAEHGKGRRLLIGTTNLDAQRPVIWDMGAIAASGHPKALELFRTVMRASASIPVAFTPVYLAVEAEGKTYDEMQVDGGVAATMFLLGSGLGPEATRAISEGARQGRPVNLYVLRSGQVMAQYDVVRPLLKSIASHAMDAMGRFQVLNDMMRLYSIARSEGMTYHVAYVPGDFKDQPANSFDPKFMSKLFHMAYDKAVKGYPWEKTPPVVVGLGESQKKTP